MSASDQLTTRRRRRGLLLAAALYLASGLYVIRPAEQGVVRLFGRVVAARVQPGLRYRAPWPWSKLTRVKPRERKRLTIGFQAADQPLGRQPSAAETQFLTGDTNVVNIQAVVHYSLADSQRYLFAAKEAKGLIGAAVRSAMTEVMAKTSVDDILTVGKVAVQNETLARASEILEAYDLGVTLTQVTIQKPYPPAEVLAAFNDVTSAREDQDRIKNEAHGYANDVVPRARGEAQRLLAEAEGYRATKINRAAGEAKRFEELLTEYRKAKDVTATRLYVESMEEILPKLKKVVVDSPAGDGPLDLTLIKTPPAGAAGEPSASGASTGSAAPTTTAATPTQ